jgi:glutathione S-transferase
VLHRSFDVATSWTSSVLRLGSGLFSGHQGPRPELPIELWEFEGCPFCRKVREALTFLDLEAIVHPCPKGGPNHRAEVVRRGGREMFPYLHDPNTGVEMYESKDIVRYLYEHYGNRSAPWWLASDASVPLGSLASVLRVGRGVRYQPSQRPELPLELWSFEASPYCRIAREALCELELTYLLHNVGKLSPSRRAFKARSGRMMVPWLLDPNTGREMFESAAIREYLYTTYASG